MPKKDKNDWLILDPCRDCVSRVSWLIAARVCERYTKCRSFVRSSLQWDDSRTSLGSTSLRREWDKDRWHEIWREHCNRESIGRWSGERVRRGVLCTRTAMNSSEWYSHRYSTESCAFEDNRCRINLTDGWCKWSDDRRDAERDRPAVSPSFENYSVHLDSSIGMMGHEEWRRDKDDRYH